MNESREVLESTGEHTAPIFVDTTGRRRRLLRRLGYGVGAACVGYAIVLAISLSGGPISPDKVLPGYPKPTPRPTAPQLGPPRYVPPNSAMGGGQSPGATAAPAPGAPGATGPRASTAPSGRPRSSSAPTAAPSPSTAPSPSATPSDSVTPTTPEDGGSPPAQPEAG